MQKMPNLMLLLASLAGLAALPGLADLDAVDAADSMDFERFHATDVWSIGIGQAKPVRPKRELNKAQGYPTEQPSRTIARVANSNNMTARTAQKGGYPRQISNPYGFDSNRSFQSAADATEVLFRNMAKQCPKGWQKDREWSTPTTDGFLLHYEFHCLNQPS